MSHSNEQQNDQTAEEQVLSDEALESVAGGASPGGVSVGGGIGPITTTVAGPIGIPPVQLTITSPIQNGAA